MMDIKKYDKELFNHELILQFNHKYYENIINTSDISGGEIALNEIIQEENPKTGEPAIKEKKFFYPVAIEHDTYLLRSEDIDKLPLRILDFIKISHNSTAYRKIVDIKPLKIRPEQTMSYKEMVDGIMAIDNEEDHETPELFKLWKIIWDCAYTERINIRLMTYPGWGKDGLPKVYRFLLGDVVAVNKPNYARLKKEICSGNKAIILNEIQKLSEAQARMFDQFYEDTGDFNPEFNNPTRTTGGTNDKTIITDLSTVTFYNVPKTNKDPIFDDQLEGKNSARIFPLFFEGGRYLENGDSESAVKYQFSSISGLITPAQMQEIIKYNRALRFYSLKENWLPLVEKKNWKPKYKLKNSRYQRNFETICRRISLYSETKEEFDKWVDLLYDRHKKYFKFLQERRNPAEKVEFGGLKYDEVKIN